MNCPICDRGMIKMLDMPRFPLTEKYEPWTEDFEEGRGVVDQSFHYCEACSHGRLGTVVPGLYGDDYRTTTAASEGSKRAVDNFAWFVRSRVHGIFDVAIDIGANDSTLLSHFEAERVAVDPNARGDALCIKERIEDADLSRFADRKKIILSSHTIEHLERPEFLIGKAAQIMKEGDYLALQCPSLELLLEDLRIDQIHHQHIHYFSQRSLNELLYRHGLKSITWRFDEAHWGAVMVLAVKGLGLSVGKNIASEIVEYAIDDFQENSFEVPLDSVAYGASLMLPVLAYWFPLENVRCIVDDDPSKDGLRYVNFNKRIVYGHGLQGENVVITGISSKMAGRALTKKAIEQGAQRIILPLHTL